MMPNQSILPNLRSRLGRGVALSIEEPSQIQLIESLFAPFAI